MSLDSLVDALFADSDVQRMLALSTHSEPLQICYPKEVNISRFLAWLIDPTQGHGLGDQAIKSMLTRAGLSAEKVNLSLNDRRFLAAANIHTLAFSSIVVITEAELGLPGERRYVDVLAVDPAAKLYVAIENKFGHFESKDQTKTYYKALRKLFPSFRGIHLYLDSNDHEPEDDHWVPVNYTWLTEFITQVEQLTWVAPHVKATMAQFRFAIQEEDDLAEGTAVGTIVTTVASRHGEVLDALHEILTPNAPRSRAKDLAALLNGVSSGNDAKANIRLFQLYSRRPQVWDRCLKERKFAKFYHVLRAQFSHLTADPRRVVTYFSLKEFERLLDPDLGTFWAAAISVRQDGEHFRVTTFLSLSCVKAEYRTQLLNIAKLERARNSIRQPRRDDGNITIRKGTSLPPVKAVEDASAQLQVLRGLLKDI
ncbi:PD-(D/E)XK nuclease family protein [Pseudomonas sp. OA65]|uniref:PDDEXK-like family protein n=1 Tax=Pseudomonas sp. OA65 TaxID=2818431 RepID=UPI001A9E9299|nr:PD-(D/E)XK nuclease family protein [Pseudomonas sp. OA65]MBO1536739.1 PD-(D/E)XK nuclease family protein [Pseudomonas sp. OA65]